MSVGKVLGSIIILAIIMFGITFGIAALSVTDENVDMIGSDYEGTYNTSKVISIQSMSMLNVVMYIIIAAAIIIAVKTFY